MDTRPKYANGHIKPGSALIQLSVGTLEPAYTYCLRLRHSSETGSILISPYTAKCYNHPADIAFEHIVSETGPHIANIGG